MIEVKIKNKEGKSVNRIPFGTSVHPWTCMPLSNPHKSQFANHIEIHYRRNGA